MRNRVWAVLGLVLVAGGCAGNAGEEAPPAAPPPPPPPSPELVTWAGNLCQATSSLASRQVEFEGLDVDVAEPDIFASVTVSRYLSSADSSLRQLAGRFTGLPPSGLPAADDFAKGLGAGVERILPEAQSLGGSFSAAFEEDFGPVYERAKKLDELLDSVKPAGPDLPALLAAEPRLAAAHQLAPACAPPASQPPSAVPGAPVPPAAPGDPVPSAVPGGPLPPAADGTDFAACADGNCQILLTGKAEVAVGDHRFTISLTERSVTLKEVRAKGASSVMSTGAGGKAGWSTAGSGQRLEMTVTALNAEGAVLDFKTQ